MKTSSFAIALAVIFAGILAVYSSAADSNPYTELTKVPSKESARTNPMEHDPDAIAAGGKLYSLHCAECHGANGEGGKNKKKGPALRASEIQQATPGTLFWLLTNGSVRRGMPVWSKLPEPQRWQIVTYVKSLNASPAPTAGTR
jgi:mono/diheme cytochrome c family protein